jgi:membrane-bound lytic murein transglycosylase B
MLSALAGSGLTVAGLGGPLAGGALAADAAVSPSSPGEGTTTPVTTTPASSTPAAGTTETAGALANTSTTTTPTPSTAQSTTSQPATTPAVAPPVVEAPTVVVQRRQKTTPSKNTNSSNSNLTTTATQTQPTTGSQPAGNEAKGPTTASGPNGVAPSPQLVAAQAGALAAELASSAASVQALGFYRIPLFLLPIYQAAAIQYGVPWQILAAINEVETDYGSDLSVSSAGAEGWMQFEPSTWLQYGVDALDAGYADPYNPVDAIFAAARYLHAAGASKNLHTAILAYNHSEAYAESVLLRAKLISSYPKSVIATLTGLVDARLPVTGKQVSWGSLLPTPPSPSTLPSASSATANAKAVAGATKTASGAAATTDSAAQAGTSGSTAAGSTPGSMPAPAPAVAADAASGTAAATGSAVGTADAAPQFVELLSASNASVVAVQDGRVLALGHSHKLGKYVILRDIYGDVFTYAGLGTIAPNYRLPKVPSAALIAVAKQRAADATGGVAAATAGAAGAEGDTPLTLHVKRSHSQTTNSQNSIPSGSAESVPAATGKVRLFAHPGNPDALAAAARVTTTTPAKGSGKGLALQRGSLVAEGTVLGHVLVPKGAKDGHLRFSVQPAGDSGSIDPRPVLANWKELDEALHPQGAKAQSPLLGATASDVFLLSKSQLELAVLSDPGIDLDGRARHEISTGAIDRRVLAVLAFLSRSGLKPAVQAVHRGPRLSTPAGHSPDAETGGAVDISAINGIPIAGHEGAGSITDGTIRTLLTLQGEFVPSQIVSLMKYPAAANTFATTAHADAIQIDFQPTAAALASTPKAAAKAARAAAGKTASAQLSGATSLSLTQWNELLTRVGAIPAPKLAAKPTSAAIRDPQAAQSNRGLGSSSSSSGE